MSAGTAYERIRRELPETVTIVLAAKWRTPEEVREVIAAGATDIGENYVQEADRMAAALGPEATRVRWHMIGALQTNKITRALRLFDVVQTVDGAELAVALNRRAAAAGSVLPVFIEVNIAGEDNKSGCAPEAEAVAGVLAEISALPHVRAEGLMTMGPAGVAQDVLRKCFRTMRRIYETVRHEAPAGAALQTLSMGMSDSYRMAIDEGATMVRLGSVVFGPRCRS